MYVKKAQVLVNFEIKEGNKAHLNVEVYNNDKNLDYDGVAKILAGGLALTIRASDNQGQLMGEIVNYLNDEFVNPHSFDDLKTKKY